ncbi:hypothetical protein ES288_D04G193500v1 [Gossypium darwinii]|uniref:Uncharacterized protein n=1 Tax=Gossypium darwinii TaxID=34276 RepID=A0A5D2CY40_GOSDA|nr:hypothetical protein ES288_D04G193500v1 [Gossypium darwinii]
MSTHIHKRKVVHSLYSLLVQKVKATTQRVPKNGRINKWHDRSGCINAISNKKMKTFVYMNERTTHFIRQVFWYIRF